MNFMTQLYPERYGQSKIIGSRLLNLKNGNLPDLYVVDIEPDGWVMVSSDKRYAPIMAYGTEGRVTNAKEEEMPPASLFWLEMNMEAQRQTTDDDASNIRQWEELLGNSTASIIDPDDCEEVSCQTYYYYTGRQENGVWTGFTKTEWSQGSNSLGNYFHPYNNFFPDQLNYKPYAGCVPISVSQIIRYHEYENLPTLSYEWSAMPNISTSSSFGDYEVARLIWDVARRMRLYFSPNGTGAYLKNAIKRDAIDALHDFGYSCSFQRFNRGVNTVLIENSLKQGLPVILGGSISDENSSQEYLYGLNSGHAWVCDGYLNVVTECIIACEYIDGDRTTVRRTETKFYHMNWGWGDIVNVNGWYADGRLGNPRNVSGNPQFNYNMEILYDIKPQ